MNLNAILMELYTFNQHRHNFATWAAARAVQRNFATTSKIKYGIEQSGLREFAESDEKITVEGFNCLHRIWAKRIDIALKEKEITSCTYGRAAKIISIYLKTSVVLCNQGACNRSGLIHPPIDGILLKNISQQEGLNDLRTVRWTRISENDYWNLVSRLSEYFRQFDWRLEYYWRPELD